MGLGYRAGSEIPGYAGHVPGRRAEGLVGETISRANFLANAVKRRQYTELRDTYARQLKAAGELYARSHATDAVHNSDSGNTGLYPLMRSLTK